MPKQLSFILILMGIGIVSFFLLKPEPKAPSQPIHLPWDIMVLDNGTTQVFGLTLETTTLGEALKQLGEDHELAVITNQNNDSALEAFFSHFTAGPLKAKLILVVDASEEFLKRIEDNPINTKLMATGARQHFLSEEQIQEAKQLPIKSISLTPGVNLKQDLIVHRFGDPEEIIVENENTTHLLYPDLGLDAVINTEAKEQLMYVAPRSFEAIETPLKAIRN